MPERSAEQIQRDIEQARDVLAASVDEIAARTNPQRLTDQAKQVARERATSPAGRAVIIGVGALFVVYLVWRVRR